MKHCAKENLAKKEAEKDSTMKERVQVHCPCDQPLETSGVDKIYSAPGEHLSMDSDGHYFFPWHP